MSAPFSPENRHHLLLAEAHQVNEFLDARLIGAEVPDDERADIARAVLALALASRRGFPTSIWSNGWHLPAGIADLIDALPLTIEGRAKLAADIAAAEALLVETTSAGCLDGSNEATRAIGLFVYLTDKGWPGHFATACALAETDLSAKAPLTLLGTLPVVSTRPQRPAA